MKDTFKRTEILFDGWINHKIYLTIVNGESEVWLFFGNIKEKQKIYKVSTGVNENNYPTVYTGHFKKLPKEYQKLIKERGVVLCGKEVTTTTLQRLIEVSQLDLNDKEVHHIDFRVENNKFNNLFPLSKRFHGFLHHENYRIKGYFDINFEKRRVKLIQEQKTLGKRAYNSKFRQDRMLFMICYWKYIKKYPAKEIKIRKDPSQRTIESILPMFYEFNEYYSELMLKIKDLFIPKPM